MHSVCACRGSVTAAQAKSALTAVFEVAPHCVDAKLLQAEILLEEQDYGGMLSHLGWSGLMLAHRHALSSASKFVGALNLKSVART